MGSDKTYFYSKISLFFYVVTIFTLSIQKEFSIVSQSIGIIMVGIFLMEYLMLEKKRFLFPIPLMIFLFYFFILLVSSIFVSGEYVIISTLFQLIISTFIIINIIGLTGHVWPLIAGTLIGTLILNYQVWVDLGHTFNLEGSRMRIGLINANQYSLFLSLGILVSIYILFLFSSERSQKNKQWSMFIKVFLIMIIIFYSYLVINITGSKKGLIGIFLIFSAYLLFKIKQTNIYLKLLSVFILPFLFVFIPCLLKDTLGYKRLTTTDNSLDTRSEMIKNGYELWSEKPFFGWGLNQFRKVSDYPTYSHNNYIEILANNGLIGFITYYAIFISIFFTIIKLYLTVNQNKKFVLFWCALIISIILFWDIGVVSYYSKSNWLLISLVIGLLMSIKIDLKKSNFKK